MAMKFVAVQVRRVSEEPVFYVMKALFTFRRSVTVFFCLFLTATLQTAAQNRVELLFAYGSEKEEWINEATAAFNRLGVKTAEGRVIRVQGLPMGSGECMDRVANGSLKANLVSPASGIFIKLANAEARTRTGKDLVGDTENLVLSPVVIAVWKPMAEALGWGTKPVGWSEILALSKNPEGWSSLQAPQWGQFKLGHTHPEFSNSGLISILAETYAGAGKTAGLSLGDVARPEVEEFVRGIESTIVHYGASTGFFGKKMFQQGPGYLSAAVLYENMIVEANSGKYQLPFPIVAIYPKEGTFWSDHPAGVVDAEWNSPEQRRAAKRYIQFLLAPEQQRRAQSYGFRPGLVDIALASPLDKAHGVDPSEPKTTLEVPKPEVIQAVGQLWQKAKKHSRVVLVMDTSGSMNSGGRIENARKGAAQMLRLMKDADTFSLIAFNTRINWAMRSQPLAQGRATAEKTIASLWANGGTALYDAVLAAYDDLQKSPDSGKISAVVVLTDGLDTNSKTSLEELMKAIQFDSEKSSTRVFTIAYGDDANKAILQRIADATQAKSYAGTPENIESVFKDISTFF
jgi:Ca-activated chloride channel homolog